MPSPRATPDLRLAALSLCLAAQPAFAALPPPAGSAEGLSRILIPIGGLIVLAVVGGMGVMAVRRRLLSKDSAATDQGGLLDDLRRMRDTGQISAEEFDAARKSIAAKLSGKPLRAGPPDPGVQGPRTPGFRRP